MTCFLTRSVVASPSYDSPIADAVTSCQHFYIVVLKLMCTLGILHNDGLALTNCQRYVKNRSLTYLQITMTTTTSY